MDEDHACLGDLPPDGQLDPLRGGVDPGERQICAPPYVGRDVETAGSTGDEYLVAIEDVVLGLGDLPHCGHDVVSLLSHVRAEDRCLERLEVSVDAGLGTELGEHRLLDPLRELVSLPQGGRRTHFGMERHVQPFPAALPESVDDDVVDLVNALGATGRGLGPVSYT